MRQPPSNRRRVNRKMSRSLNLRPTVQLLSYRRSQRPRLQLRSASPRLTRSQRQRHRWRRSQQSLSLRSKSPQLKSLARMLARNKNDSKVPLRRSIIYLSPPPRKKSSARSYTSQSTATAKRRPPRSLASKMPSRSRACPSASTRARPKRGRWRT